jgi:CubicO group peptidase (beta-lactamase class C family)
VNGATIWHWASITKTFGAIAVMQYRDRGKLDLDDPIVQHVPELERAHHPYGPMSQVTVRHLLSHTSGFRSGTWPWGGNQPWHPFEPTEWAQVVAMLPYTRIEFPPGSKYQYSNPGYVFLGQVVSRLAGEDWEVYLQKNVLAPLGMTHAYFDITPYHLLKDRSNNYSVKDGVTTAHGLDFDTGITVSNGGLNAPLADMAKYPVPARRDAG